MQAWSEFYAVIGSAATTLLGLLFVAVSINATAILNEAHGNSQRLAEQAFQNFLAVMLVSLFALFPSLSISEFSFVTLGVTGISAFWVLVRLYLALVKPHEAGLRRQSLRRLATSLVGFGMMIFAALRMALNLDDSRNLLAASTVVLLISATAVSWELLLRIARVKQSGPG
ncbi:MAG TPA: hypothetical protein VGI20_13250 [Rhizomicrobium sp.]|jgi:hypothetical protein